MRHHTNAEAVTQKYFFEKLLRNILLKLQLKVSVKGSFLKRLQALDLHIY